MTYPFKRSNVDILKLKYMNSNIIDIKELNQSSLIVIIVKRPEFLLNIYEKWKRYVLL